jgi:hypothetical protein
MTRRYGVSKLAHDHLFALTALLSQDCAAAEPTAKQVINTARVMRLINLLLHSAKQLKRLREREKNASTRDHVGRRSMTGTELARVRPPPAPPTTSGSSSVAKP